MKAIIRRLSALEDRLAPLMATPVGAKEELMRRLASIAPPEGTEEPLSEAAFEEVRQQIMERLNRFHNNRDSYR